MEHTQRTGGVSARVIAVVLLVAIVCAGAAWIVARRSSPRGIASQYLAAWRDGNEDIRRELTTPDSLSLEDQLTRIIGKMPRAVSYRIGDTVVEGDRANVHVTGRVEWQTAEGFNFGSGVTVEFVLVRIDRKWRVDSMATLENIADEVGLPGQVLINEIRRLRDTDMSQ